VTASQGSLLKDVRPWGFWAALIACLLNVWWVASMIALTQIPDTLAQAGQETWLFRSSVGACALLTILQLPILLALGLSAAERSKARALIGSSVYAMYIPLNLAAYYLYGMVFPRIATGHDGAEPFRQIIIALDVGKPLALFGNLPILGYGLLGLGWCLLGTAVFKRSRLWRWTAAFMILSGGLSVVGALANYLDFENIALGTLLGGVFSVPALGLVGVALWMDHRSRESAPLPNDLPDDSDT